MPQVRKKTNKKQFIKQKEWNRPVSVTKRQTTEGRRGEEKINKTFRYGCTSWGSKREPCLLNTTNAASTITVLAACTPQIGVDTCILKHLRLTSNQSAESVVEPSRWKALQRADCCCCFFSLYFLWSALFLIPPTQAVLCVADCMLSLQWNLNDIIANQGLKEITQAWQGGFSRKVLFFFSCSSKLWGKTSQFTFSLDIAESWELRSEVGGRC